MNNNLLIKKLNQKVTNLERQLEKVRRSINSRNNLDIPSDPSVIKVRLAEDVPERYTIVKVVHNDSGPNTFSRAIIFGSTHPDNDLSSFIPAIALSPGSSGDHILAKVEGASFALTTPSGDAYGSDSQIKTGDKLTIETTPGFIEKGNDNQTNYFTALESRHPSESVIRVKFAIPEQNNAATNRLFVVSITSLFGGQTYFGDLWDLDSNGDFEIIENGITVVAIDDTAMVGTLTAGLRYLARRSQNFGSADNPFYFYHIQPTRVE